MTLVIKEDPYSCTPKQNPDNISGSAFRLRSDGKGVAWDRVENGAGDVQSCSTTS